MMFNYTIDDTRMMIIRSGMTLDLRTYVHLGRACRFTYVVRWSGIQRKFRHELTYFHFPVLIWQGNDIRSSRCIELTFVVLLIPFGSFRVSMSFPNPVSKQTNRQYSHFHFPVLIWQGNDIRSSRCIELTFVVLLIPFGSFRVSMSFPNPVSKQTNRQYSHQSGVFFFILREIAHS